MLITNNNLDINGLNSLFKRYTLAKWIKSLNLAICCLWEIHLTNKDIDKLKVKDGKSYSILISDKIDFNPNIVKKDEYEHYIMIKGSIQWEDVTAVNVCETKARTTGYLE